MSIFFPYSPNDVLTTLASWYNIDITNISEYQKMILCIGSNLYFFIFWGFIMYFVLKSLNWVYERLC